MKAQAGWTIWLDRREIGWASTRNRAKLQIDDSLTAWAIPEGGSGEGQDRTADTAVFSRVLYRLSYLAADTACIAVPTGFEPAFSALTGRRV